MFHQVIYFLTRVLPVKGYSCNVRNVQIDGIIIIFFLNLAFIRICTSLFHGLQGLHLDLSVQRSNHAREIFH